MQSIDRLTESVATLLQRSDMENKIQSAFSNTLLAGDNADFESMWDAIGAPCRAKTWSAVARALNAVAMPV